MSETAYVYRQRVLSEPDWRRFAGWRDVTRQEWLDVQWQRAHCLKNIRQLRDVKIKPAVETFGTAEMTIFADWCGHSLALSHARSGEPAVISGYLGKSDAFDKAIVAFSVVYADQNEKDHA